MLQETIQLADAVEAQVRAEGEAVVTVPESEPKQSPELAPEQMLTGSPQVKKMKRLAIFSGCIAALAVLATVLFLGIRSGWDVGSWFSWLQPRANTVMYKDSYTVSDKKALRKKNDVVATMDGAQLTNGVLQIYYWNEVYDFLNNNGYYLAYMGLDFTKPLDEQYIDPTNTMVQYLMGTVDSDMTWQQYFLDGAIEMWRTNQAFAELAKKNGYELDAKYRQTLSSMPQDLEEQAKKNGFANANAMVQDSMGPGCSLEDYLDYMENYYLGYMYFAELYNAVEPTLEDLDAYFTEHQADFAHNNISKDSGYTVDIRHILISIATIAKGDGTDAQHDEEGAEDAELIDGYTAQQWEACREAAQAILDQWLAGDMKEDSFAELAKKHSEDGNAKDGGIYTGVRKGDMAESFDAWCFDESREEGHYGLVRTKFGYHIMYFSGSEDIWITESRAAYMAEAAQKLMMDTMEAYPVEVNYKKIVLGEVSLG